MQKASIIRIYCHILITFSNFFLFQNTAFNWNSQFDCCWSSTFAVALTSYWGAVWGMFINQTACTVQQYLSGSVGWLSSSSPTFGYGVKWTLWNFKRLQHAFPFLPNPLSAGIFTVFGLISLSDGRVLHKGSLCFSVPFLGSRSKKGQISRTV